MNLGQSGDYQVYKEDRERQQRAKALRNQFKYYQKRGQQQKITYKEIEGKVGLDAGIISRMMNGYPELTQPSARTNLLKILKVLVERKAMLSRDEADKFLQTVFPSDRLHEDYDEDLEVITLLNGQMEQSQLPPTPSATPSRHFTRRRFLIGLGGIAGLAVVSGGLTLLVHQFSSVTPVYQADFTKTETWQEWRKINNENQWKYDAEYKALASDGSVPFNDFTNLLLVAPYHPAPDFPDYAVEAKITVTGLNESHPYTQVNPPFFGFFVRGGALNDKGYAVLLLVYPNHKLGVGAEGQLNILGTNPTQHRESGGYTFDDQPHTYRVEVRGDTIRFLVSTKEGSTTEIFNLKDDNYQNGSIIGIEDYGCQLRVYDFIVYPL